MFFRAKPFQHVEACRLIEKNHSQNDEQKLGQDSSLKPIGHARNHLTVALYKMFFYDTMITGNSTIK